MAHDFKPNDAVVRKDDPEGTILFVDRVFGDAITCTNPMDEKRKIYMDACQLRHKNYAKKNSTTDGVK